MLAVQDPDRHPIYDARVAVALNSLILVGRDDTAPCLFPSLPSRNTAIKRFNAWLRPSRDRATIGRSEVYTQYCRLVQAVGSETGLQADGGEMILFAHAEALASQAMLDGRWLNPDRAAAC